MSVPLAGLSAGYSPAIGVMAPSQLNHRMFIDDQNATVGSPKSRVSFFQFDDQLWEDREGRGSFMGTHTYAPVYAPASLAAIHFVGECSFAVRAVYSLKAIKVLESQSQDFPDPGVMI